MSANITRIVVYDESGAERTYDGPVASELSTFLYWESRRGPRVEDIPTMMAEHCDVCRAIRPRAERQPLTEYRVRLAGLVQKLCRECLESLGAQIASALTPHEESLGDLLARATPDQRHIEGGEEYAPRMP